MVEISEPFRASEPVEALSKGQELKRKGHYILGSQRSDGQTDYKLTQ